MKNVKKMDVQNDLKTGKILTLDEAARYLNVSKSAMYKKTHLREIPFYKPNGKRCYFMEQDLDAWVLRSRIPTAEETETEAANRIVQSKIKKGGRK
jgi:excisionase family DNA binding protein